MRALKSHHYAEIMITNNGLAFRHSIIHIYLVLSSSSKFTCYVVFDYLDNFFCVMENVYTKILLCLLVSLADESVYRIRIKRCYFIFICPIAIAYSYGTDNKISLRLSVCLSEKYEKRNIYLKCSRIAKILACHMKSGSGNTTVTSDF